MGKTIKLENDTYIANEIYSTRETIIGTWLDKPLYRKVIPYLPTSIVGATGTTTTVAIPHGISNIGLVIDHRLIDTNKAFFPRTASSNGTTLTAGACLIQYDYLNTYWRIINDTWSARQFYIVLEYTKTTD